jgi:hypothetical protein
MPSRVGNSKQSTGYRKDRPVAGRAMLIRYFHFPQFNGILLGPLRISAYDRKPAHGVLWTDAARLCEDEGRASLVRAFLFQLILPRTLN